MRHKLCRSFHPWCPGVKNRCLLCNCDHFMPLISLKKKVRRAFFVHWIYSINFTINAQCINVPIVSLNYMLLRDDEDGGEDSNSDNVDGYTSLVFSWSMSAHNMPRLTEYHKQDPHPRTINMMDVFVTILSMLALSVPREWNQNWRSNCLWFADIWWICVLCYWLHSKTWTKVPAGFVSSTKNENSTKKITIIKSRAKSL